LFWLFTFALNVPLEVSKQNTIPHSVLESSSLQTPHHLFNVGWKRFTRCCTVEAVYYDHFGTCAFW
jgi:hypothetical protein